MLKIQATGFAVSHPSKKGIGCTALVHPLLQNNAQESKRYHCTQYCLQWNFDPLTQPSFRPSGATKRLGPGPTATALDPSLSSVSASTSTGSRLDRSGALTSTNRDRSATPAHEAHAVAASRKPNVTMGSVILDLAALKKRIGELEELDKERQSELAKVKRKAEEDRLGLEMAITAMNEDVEGLQDEVKELKELLNAGGAMQMRGGDDEDSSSEIELMTKSQGESFQMSADAVASPSFKVSDVSSWRC